MSQQDIYDFLLLHRTRWFSTREIRSEGNLDCGLASMSQSLKKLRKYDFVRAKRDVRFNSGYLYKINMSKIKGDKL